MYLYKLFIAAISLNQLSVQQEESYVDLRFEKYLNSSAIPQLLF